MPKSALELNYLAITKSLLSTQKKITSASKSITKIVIEANNIEVDDIIDKFNLKKKIDKGNWTGLSETSAREVRKSGGLLDDLIKHSENRDGYLTTRDEALKTLKPYIHDVQKMENWKKRKKALKKIFVEQGMSNAQANRCVKNVEEFDLKEYLSVLSMIDKNKNKLIESSFNKLLRLYIKYFYANCCARTNLLSLGVARPSIREDRIRLYEKEVSGRFLELRKVISKNNHSEIVKYTEQLEKPIYDSLWKKLLPLASVLTKVKTTNKQEFDRNMDLSLRVGALIRKSIFLIAITKRVRVYAGAKRTSNFGQWAAHAKNLKKIDAQTTRTRVGFGVLAGKGKSYNNKSITIKGRVLKLEIRHVGKKPISHAYITDGKYIVIATIPHIKIDSSGMSLGSYAEITGVWKQKCKEALGKPSLLIDRVDNSKLSKNYWLPWLVLSANDIYEMMPHSVNTNISWKPGKSGCINPIKYAII